MQIPADFVLKITSWHIVLLYLIQISNAYIDCGVFLHLHAFGFILFEKFKLIYPLINSNLYDFFAEHHTNIGTQLRWHRFTCIGSHNRSQWVPTLFRVVYIASIGLVKSIYQT